MRPYLILLSIIFLLSCNPKSLPTFINFSPEKIVVKLSHQTTKAELDKLRFDLLEQHKITLSYEGSTFFENDMARDLKISVTTADGRSGNFYARLAQLQYTYYGFHISLNDRYMKIGQM